jgi:4-hydroxy-tetrahydrodipicolinate reductase
MLRLAIAGAGGRMGRMLLDAAAQDSNITVVAAFEHAASPLLGNTVHPGLKITADVAAGLAHADVMIDFTQPAGTLAHLPHCLATNTALVIGTTGFEEAGKATINAASRSIPIMFAPNMSVGVNLSFKLLELAAQVLKDGYDVEIVEMHHKHKVDAPSGTALKMGEIVAEAQGSRLADRAVYSREGVTGARPANAIGFATLRGGDIVGDHTVVFAGEGERIEITHKSSSRATYAAGSMRAAHFLLTQLQAKKTGLFDMQDVLGLRR